MALPACLLLTILAACAGQLNPEPVERDLPPAPAVMGPIAKPALHVGQDAREALAVCIGAVDKRDRRALGSLRWYQTLRAELAKPIAGL